MHGGPRDAKASGVHGRRCQCDLAVRAEGWGRQDALRVGIVDCEIAAKRFLHGTIET